MLIRMLLLSLMILTIGSVAVAGQENQTEPGLVVLEDFDCLPSRDMGLSNIRLRMREADVLLKLGNPISTAKSWSEDAGGRYDVTTYHYATFSLNIGRGEVERIYTNSSKQKTPEKIQVGDRREEVIKKLGATPRDWKSDIQKVSLTTCPEDTSGGQLFRDDYVTYTFGPDARLITITYEVIRP